MSTAKPSLSPSARSGACSLAGSLNKGSPSLQELRSQVAALSGGLVLVSEKEHTNGYSVHYKVIGHPSPLPCCQQSSFVWGSNAS